MEASALHAPAGLARARLSVSAPLLRLRSDEQLLALFRAGHDDAFRAIHDRYRQRLFAYTKQMLPGSSQDAEDALQDVFIRAYSGLRANRRELALRPWLYRVAHNRCIDELRRPAPPASELLHQASVPTLDPAARAEQREALQRLIADLRRLPDQQRSALLMRELGGMACADIAGAMEVSVPAVKSLLVRARIGLALAAEARDTACSAIREEVTLAHDRGVRASGNVRRHLADCAPCREFRADVRRSRAQFAALLPALGPMGMLANLLGIGSGGAGAAATGGATATTGAVAGGGTAATVGTFVGSASHVATLIAAAVVTAGGAVALQNTVASTHHRPTDPAGAAIVRSSTPFASPAPRGASSPADDPASPSTPATITSRLGPQRESRGPSEAGSTPRTRTPVSGGDNIVPTSSPPSGATETTAGSGQPSTNTATTTGASVSGTTSTTGCNSTATTVACMAGSTGGTSSTGSAATTGSTATGSTGTGAGSGTSVSSPSANPSGSTSPPTAGTSTGTPNTPST